MKNKFWAFVLALLIISPSVVAAVNYFSTNGSTVNQNSISSVTMTDLYNEEFRFEKSGDPFNLDDIRTNMVQYFTEVSTSAKSEPELPEPLKGTKYFKVILNNFDREMEYKYYFTKQPEYCYFLDEDNKCFSITREHAVAFLNSVYGRSIFDNATLPIMTTPAGDIIEPTDISWTYLAADNMAPTYKANDPSAATDTVYNIAEHIALAFSIPASSLDVKVEASGESMYNGPYDNLAFANIPTNTELSVTVNAKWYETEERQSKGEASYFFRCRLTDKPVSGIGFNSETIYPGDFVTLSVKNAVSKPSEVQCITTPDLKITPEFYSDGYMLRALLPIPLSTPAGSYSVKLVVDGVEQNLDFTVTERNFSTKHENIGSTLLNDDSVSQFNEAMKEVYAAKDATKYFDGEFIYPVNGSVVSSGFGRPTVTSNGYSYTNEWVRVLASTGSNVLAMNSGKVVYTGELTMTGKTVVIDHGLGLMSVYANMTSLSVNVGDVVSTGDTLGVSGAAGYADGTTVSVALVINGTYVCPYEIWDAEGIIFEDPTPITFTQDELTPPVETPEDGGEENTSEQ